ncbi:MAG: hypothetical protein K2Q18_00270, partial [Bdellovibrionales bacterium]|nr:hypothetical protein [Bdellovibrionales bacterium]
SIQIEQGKTENKFLLLDGTAKLANQEILTNQVVIQNITTGELRIKEIPFIPKMPSHNMIQYFLHEAPLHFAWSYTNQSMPAKLIIARDSNFSDILFNETTENNSLDTSLNLSGTYYWKISSDIEGPIKSFTLIEETLPSINADQTTLYVGPKSNDSIFINWSKNNGKNFALKTEFPNGKTEEIEISKNTYDFIPKSIGLYKLSVKVKDENRPLALWSEPLHISLNEAKAISISSLTPELIEKVNYNDQSSNYLLSWNGPASGVSYKVKVSKDNKTTTQETSQASTPINLKEAGVYNWEVQGETSSGVPTNKISGKIIIKTPLHITQLPSEGAVIELEKPDQLVSFKWDKVDEATLYQFELSDEPTFKKIILDRDIDSNNISTSLADIGKYYWRVKIKKGDTLEYSRPVSVEIKPAPPLARPEVSPDIKIKLKYLEEKSSSFNLIDLFISKAQADDYIVAAEWDLPANPKAKSYTVEVYKDSELKDLLIRLETATPHVVWKNAVAGVFYWRVSYTDFWGRQTEFSKVSTLSTEEIEPVKPLSVEIDLLSPVHRSEILKEESSHATLSWVQVPETSSYQVLIATDLDFKNVILKKTVDKNDLKISCKDFDARPGEYIWKVISGENASKRRIFTISCAPPVVVVAPPPTPVIEKTPETKKIIEVPRPIILKPSLPLISRPNRHLLKLGLIPHHIAYENKASTYSAKIDGNALDSWFVSYEKPLNLKYFQVINPKVEVSRGKVFKSITFTDIELNLKAKRFESSFSWGPLAAFMKKTIYIESSFTIIDENVSSPLAGVFIQKNMNQFTINAEIKFGSMLAFHADIEYRMKNNLSIGAFMDSTSLSKDNNDHAFIRYGLNLNYTFDFLDNAK